MWLECQYCPVILNRLYRVCILRDLHRREVLARSCDSSRVPGTRHAESVGISRGGMGTEHNWVEIKYES